MIILDPELNGCIVWCINSPFKENFLTHIKGNVEEVMDAILPHITTYADVKDQFGNKRKALVLTDMVYIDGCHFTMVYVDAFERLGLHINIIQPRSSNVYFGNERKWFL